MSENVIAFPGVRAVSIKRMARGSRGSLGATVDVALWIHTCIVEGLLSGRFDHHDGDAPPALAEALISAYGMDFVVTAQEQFEAVYGCDPYTFLDRMISLRSERYGTQSLEN